VILALLFYQLSVEIDHDYVNIRFGIGLIRKKWLIKNIERAVPVKNNVLHGWGIHFSFNTTIYNVSGMKSVELTFKNSRRKVRIGTPDPEKHADYINQMVLKKRKLA